MYACEICGVSVTSGVTIHRTSPKGAPFQGRCEGCLDHKPDPLVTQVTDVIEDHNRGYPA